VVQVQVRCRQEQQPLLDEAWKHMSSRISVRSNETTTYSRLSGRSTEVTAGAPEDGTEAGLALTMLEDSATSGR
jgi:hypothetical protein